MVIVPQSSDVMDIILILGMFHLAHWSMSKGSTIVFR